MSKEVAEILVEVLEQAGVKRCYGIVGDTLNLFAEHLEASPIDWVHVRHEEAGGSTPISRTLTKRPIEVIRSVHVEAKKVQCGVQARCG